jgi:hypothetical protein
METWLLLFLLLVLLKNDLLFTSFHKYVNFFAIKNYFSNAVSNECKTHSLKKIYEPLFMDKDMRLGFWHEILSMAGQNEFVSIVSNLKAKFY